MATNIDLRVIDPRTLKWDVRELTDGNGRKRCCVIAIYGDFAIALGPTGMKVVHIGGDHPWMDADDVPLAYSAAIKAYLGRQTVVERVIPLTEWLSEETEAAVDAWISPVGLSVDEVTIAQSLGLTPEEYAEIKGA